MRSYSNIHGIEISELKRVAADLHVYTNKKKEYIHFHGENLFIHLSRRCSVRVWKRTFLLFEATEEFGEVFEDP